MNKIIQIELKIKKFWGNKKGLEWKSQSRENNPNEHDTCKSMDILSKSMSIVDRSLKITQRNKIKQTTYKVVNGAAEWVSKTERILTRLLLIWN